MTPVSYQHDICVIVRKLCAVFHRIRNEVLDKNHADAVVRAHITRLAN